MDLWEGSKYAAAILGALLLAVICDWLSGAMYPVTYLVRPAYIVPGVAEPTVDLAELRRHWPQALASPADRARLLGYMRDMRKVASINPAQESAASGEPAVEQLPDFATAILPAGSKCKYGTLTTLLPRRWGKLGNSPRPFPRPMWLPVRRLPSVACNAMSGTRAAPTRSAPISTASSDVPAPPTLASTTHRQSPLKVVRGPMMKSSAFCGRPGATFRAPR